MENDGPGFTIDISDEVFFASVIVLIVLAAVGLVTLIAVRLWRTWQPRHRMRAIDDLSRSMNLVIPADLREPLAHAVAVRTRGREIGWLVGFGGMVAAFRLWETPAPAAGFGAARVALALALVCTSMGAVVGGLLARRPTPSSPRTARLTSLTYADLIAPYERRIVAISVACGVAIPAVFAMAAAGPWTDGRISPAADAGLLLLVGLLGAGLWLALPRISRRLVASRALPGDEHALAWSDALAARTVRDLAYLAVSLSILPAMYSLMGMGLALPRDWTAAVPATTNIGMGLGLAAMLAALIVVSSRSPERHVQRTLWPQFAADAQ
jgi:hypothetical protein